MANLTPLAAFLVLAAADSWFSMANAGPVDLALNKWNEANRNRATQMSFRGKKFAVEFEKGPSSLTGEQAVIPGSLTKSAGGTLPLTVLFKEKDSSFSIKAGVVTGLTEFIRSEWPDLSTDDKSSPVSTEFLTTLRNTFAGLLQK